MGDKISKLEQASTNELIEGRAGNLPLQSLINLRDSNRALSKIAATVDPAVRSLVPLILSLARMAATKHASERAASTGDSA